MHSHTLDDWRHDHVFLGAAHDRNERRTWLVVGLTTAMMVVEIAGGSIFGSMALLADGWHMSTHAGALAIAAFAYRFARSHARDPRFAFGTGKLGDLAGFTSAIVLALVALGIGYESVVRLLQPVAIHYNEAIVIAVAGLGVNLASAWLLGGEHHHEHAHAHGHDDHDHDDHDHDEHDDHDAGYHCHWDPRCRRNNHHVGACHCQRLESFQHGDRFVGHRADPQRDGGHSLSECILAR